VHFLAAVAVIAAGAVLQINLVEWCILTGCVFAVLTSEMVNSSLEMLVRGTASGPRTEYRDALDMAAGAVLLASAGAAIVGGLVLGNAILSRLM
jgi:diacylglycerol kinase